MVLLFAAHQGEELTLILPAIMLVGAFFIFRWANQKPEGEEDELEAASPKEQEAVSVPVAQNSATGFSGEPVPPATTSGKTISMNS
jgi:hypothetical protein